MIDLNRLCSVSFLGVQFSALANIDRLNKENILLLKMVTVRLIVVWSGDDGLSSRIEAKVCLIHQLLVEGRVNCGIAAGTRSSGRVRVVHMVTRTLGVAILEQFRQD